LLRYVDFIYFHFLCVFADLPSYLSQDYNEIILQIRVKPPIDLPLKWRHFVKCLAQGHSKQTCRLVLCTILWC